MAAPLIAIEARAADVSGASTANSTPSPQEKPASLYVQCDGNPNNMAAGETIARFLGAITLLALFAPSPEQPDPKKRKFGNDGVVACDGVIEGPNAEHNVLRRLPLILARALHRIEARDYEAAIQDVNLARAEAERANLISNPYFNRSMGLSFDLIEGAALVREGKPDEAQAVTMRAASSSHYSYYPLLVVRNYRFATHQPSETLIGRLRDLNRLGPTYVLLLSEEYDELGRFAEAGAVLADVAAFEDAAYKDAYPLFVQSRAAISFALAGDWQSADDLHDKIQTQIAQLKSDGKKVPSEAAVIELLDFYDVLKLAQKGNWTDARRNFAARSRWIAPTFGQVIETNRRLRANAKPAELFGSLGKTPEEMWETRLTEAKAAMLESDKKGDLFKYLLPYASVSGYERLSRSVWKTTGNGILSKQPPEGFDGYVATIAYADAMTQPDALLLHCALQAKARGKTGFVIRVFQNTPQRGVVKFGNVGDPGMAKSLYLDADSVIADLRQIIPPPEELAARHAGSAKSSR